MKNPDAENPDPKNCDPKNCELMCGLIADGSGFIGSAVCLALIRSGMRAVILSALEDRPVPVYGDGAQVRDWLHVEDHAQGLIALMERGRPGEKYNFGGDSERSNLAVVTRICDRLDALHPLARPRRALIAFVAARPGHDRRYAIDAGKARRELGWQPQHTFERGLDETIGWYLEHRSWWEPLRRSVYDGERLGLIAVVP